MGTLFEADKNMLVLFEKKVFRMIFGGMCESEGFVTITICIGTLVPNFDVEVSCKIRLVIGVLFIDVKLCGNVHRCRKGKQPGGDQTDFSEHLKHGKHQKAADFIRR